MKTYNPHPDTTFFDNRFLFFDLIKHEGDYLKIYVKEKGKSFKEAKYYYANLKKLKEDMRLLVIRDFEGKEIEGSILVDHKDIGWKDLGKVGDYSNQDLQPTP